VGLELELERDCIDPQIRMGYDIDRDDRIPEVQRIVVPLD